VDGAVLSAVGSSGKGAFNGAQLSTVVALHRGPFHGVQAASVALAWDSLEGAQLGLVNGAGSIAGLQLGLVNVAERADVALGLVNVSSRQQGLQLGLVNVAERVQGSQVGLVNVAREVDGEQVGLVSAGARLRLTSWVDLDADRDAVSHAGIKFQGRTFYSLFGFGVSPSPAPTHRFVSSLALGARAAFSPLFLQADFGMAGLHASDFAGESPGMLRYRATLGLDLTSWLAIYAGGGVEHEILPDQEQPRGLALAGIELL
jgi:hypothetical protein